MPDPVYITDYITTDAELLDSGLIVKSTKAALTPGEWHERAGPVGPWEPWHAKAWGAVQLRLRNLKVPVEASDLSADGIEQLKEPALYRVVYLAYMAANKLKAAMEWRSLYERELSAATARLSLAGGGESRTPINKAIQFRRV